MFRAIRFIVIAAILLALAWWIGTIPGTLTAHSGNYTLQTSVPAAVLILAIIVAILTLLLHLGGRVRRAPGGIGSWRSGKRRSQGELAVQRGIVALAAGDPSAAQTAASQSRKLLGDTPLVLLITAESARLAGKPEQAKAAFQALTGHKDMAFLGHRGLLRHHLEGGDHDVAATHALAAEDAYPGSTWLQTQRLDIALKKHDVKAALALTRSPAEIAALATAAANEAAYPADALRYAKQAIKAAPGLAPAIAAYALALRKKGRDRAAKKSLVKGWSAAPHPLIAEAYLAKFASPIERVQAAAELAKAATGHPESELLLSQTSLAAQLTGEAKRHANAAIQAGLSDKRPYTVLASLDPSPDNVTAAAIAPAPKWVCSNCSADTPDWTAICPACGKAGTLSWRASTKALAVVEAPAPQPAAALPGI
jgi:HemY protein